MSDANLVTITIDGAQYEVPKGANLVDVAKWNADTDIPVFCYHPKMDPVGMCRMCLVELGSEARDRATGDLVLNDDGTPQIRWFPKLQTACTQTVNAGMHVKTSTELVREGREHVIEFLLTSHPLDCPICDKGGECPLQNLTMEHGNGVSRMYYGDKIHMDKHYPLGDMIFLDRERCIQCARCVRFQDEVVGDDVLAFHERGRRLQIITNSDPGFDTYFSGNTTDICPVGALTTADFRFGARPWELTEIPSISPWDAAGENISLSTRIDRDFGGKAMIKRVMPRQNEQVNEIWISDKTRFGHHFTRSQERLMKPMQRRNDMYSDMSWDSAFAEVVDALKNADGDIAAIAGGMITNEDLWELRQLLSGLGSERLGAWSLTHGGADSVAQVGVGKGTNLSDLGAGDAILVIASDLEEEVPIWRLRLKQAQDRGAYLVVANARHTRMADFAAHEERYGHPVYGDVITYAPGEAVQAMTGLADNHSEIAKKLSDAENLVIVVGGEGLSLDGSNALSQAAANFLIESGHTGRANNGLLSTLPGPNGMGLHYLGYTPEATQDIMANPPKVLIIAGAEPVEDDPTATQWLNEVETVISLNLFPNHTARIADFALPMQSFAERDGTFTNGERRVQLFYTAQGPMGAALPAWKIFSILGDKLGQGRAKLSAASVMLDITKNVPAFEGMRYKALKHVERQYPDVGGDDKYYGGTAYQNKGGVGIQIATAADNGDVAAGDVSAQDAISVNDDEFLLIPTTRLYNRQSNFIPSLIVAPRVLLPYVGLSTDDAEKLDVVGGDVVEVAHSTGNVRVRVSIDESLVAGSVVMPRHMMEAATPLQPTIVTISKVSEPVLA